MALSNDSDAHSPSAPSLPDQQFYNTTYSDDSPYSPPPPPPTASNFYGNHFSKYDRSLGHSYARTYGDPSPSSCGEPSSSSSSSSLYGRLGENFPPGTDPAVIASFQKVDKDRSGFIDDNELQEALSSGYQRFSLRTIRLLMFLFKNPNNHSILKLGPQDFDAVWNCLGQWREMFQKYDTNKSGTIEVLELRDALFGLGLAVPPTVLYLLTSRYEDGSGHRAALNFDMFVECGMIIKGLTEKFKENDTQYIGSATFSYNSFMSIVIPFLVSYN